MDYKLNYAIHSRLSRKFALFEKNSNGSNAKFVNERKAEEIYSLINQYGLESCLRSVVICDNLLNNNFYEDVIISSKSKQTLKDIILNSDVDFAKIFKESPNVPKLANDKGWTFGHFLALSKNFTLENENSVEYANIEKALIVYSSNEKLASLQTKSGNTVGHFACRNKRIVSDYKNNLELNSIKNKKGHTVVDLYNHHKGVRFSLLEKNK